MAISLFDTLSRTVRPLAPADGRRLRMYCCGPTVYGPAHIGNFRSFILQDVLRRVLEMDGIDVLHVRNVTDVDDKTIRQSRAEGVPLADFTSRWTDQFHRDCTALNLLPPDCEPSATGHIKEQIRMIALLVEKNHAYAAPDGSVYFRIQSFPEYGKLSHLAERPPEAALRPAPSAVDADEYERDSAADFALWKAHKPDDGDVGWESPWGRGRPGWHIECSAMSLKHLGETIDLHSGGVDLKFPHHENEIAQSEACTGHTFARHWFHIEHLMVEGRKMSKSLGNLHTLEDVARRGFSPMALRYVLLAGHYQQQLNFTWDSLNAAASALGRLRKEADALASEAGLPASALYDRAALRQKSSAAPEGLEAVWKHLADDLNTPAALGALFSALNSGFSQGDPAGRFFSFARILYALGLNLHAETPVEIPESVRTLAEQRWKARTEKDWAAADALREELKAAGWSMLDGKESYRLAPLKKT